MNILFWTELFHPHIGGIEACVGNLASELSRRGHVCGVITDAYLPGLSDEEHRNGVSIFRLPIRKVISQRDLREMKVVAARASDLRRSFGADVDAVFVSGPSFLLNRLSTAPGKTPMVASIQTEAKQYLQPGSPLRRFLMDCAQIVTVSDFVRRDVASSAPELRARTLLMPNCLPDPSIPRLPLPLNPPVILCIGRLVADKGFDVALRAFGRLGGCHCQARMIVAGEGPERENLEALSRALGLERRVEFLGRVEMEDVPPLINRSSLMLTPSRWQEASGNVNLQAAQMGRPVVATRVGGIAEVVEDGRTGLLVDNGDVDEMAKALECLLGNAERIQAMGEAGRSACRTGFRFLTLCRPLRGFAGSRCGGCCTMSGSGSDRLFVPLFADVSVLMPVYNGERYVAEALRSIRAQTVPCRRGHRR